MSYENLQGYILRIQKIQNKAQKTGAVIIMWIPILFPTLSPSQ